MEWNVFIYDINAKKICTYNIFEHQRFRDEIEALCKYKHGIGREAFSKELKTIVSHYFWSKFEWETRISAPLNEELNMKIDVFYQILINWDKFVDYVWGY